MAVGLPNSNKLGNRAYFTSLDEGYCCSGLLPVSKLCLSVAQRWRNLAVSREYMDVNGAIVCAIIASKAPNSSVLFCRFHVNMPTHNDALS